jgi:hypothetical protein
MNVQRVDITTWLVVLGLLVVVFLLFELNKPYGGGVMVACSLAVLMAISLYRVSVRIVLREIHRLSGNTRKVGAKGPSLTLARSIMQSACMGMDIALPMSKENARKD